MKILMIPSGYYPECCGGVEVITQALSEGLVKKEHEVVVICQSSKNEEFTLNGVHVYKIKPKELKNDKKIVLEAVKQNGDALQYASEELKNDKEVVLEAVKRNRLALQYASKELKN